MDDSVRGGDDADIQMHVALYLFHHLKTHERCAGLQQTSKRMTVILSV